MKTAAQDFTLTPEEERDVVHFDPWGERDATYRVLREGFARCRQGHECAICCGLIHAGERVWFRTETDNGQIRTFRFCPECCWCIARRYDETRADDGYADDSGFQRMYARWDVGRQRAETARAATSQEPGGHQP